MYRYIHVDVIVLYALQDRDFRMVFLLSIVLTFKDRLEILKNPEKFYVNMIN